MIFSSLTATFSSLLLVALPFLADTDFSYESSSSDTGAGIAIGLFCIMLICGLVVAVFLILIPLMKIFTKAGQPGWMAFVPILNSIVIAHIVGRDWWWGVLPILNIITTFELAKAFGKSEGYGIGLVLLPYVFVPMLGFSDAQYQLPPRSPLF
ncbi:MAG: DUF5684 domain-containing protein [Acidimicrobiia bacterium]